MNPPAATYRFNPRALQRWQRERLNVSPRPDGGVDAAFRFEGSTCGNVPFTLSYRVTLGAESEGRVIRAMGCTPELDSDGQERMCSYISTKGRILETIDAEKPLLGQPLAAVLEWKPDALPAGCHCTAAYRDHKWLAVLETLHFTLVGAGAQPPRTRPNPSHENQTL